MGWVCSNAAKGPLVRVVTGALTLYRRDDPDGRPQVVEAGSEFVDQEGDVHRIGNDTNVLSEVMKPTPAPTVVEWTAAQPAVGLGTTGRRPESCSAHNT